MSVKLERRKSEGFVLLLYTRRLTSSERTCALTIPAFDAVPGLNTPVFRSELRKQTWVNRSGKRLKQKKSNCAQKKALI